MPELVPISANTDVIIDTTKVTTGFFTGNLGSLAGGNFVTSSKSATQKGYYYDMQYSSEDQFSVTYGHIAGSGSGGANETQAIYNHFKNLLISPDDISSTASNGFKFEGIPHTSSSVTANVSDYEDYMYFIVMDRARMKDRINKKNWTLKLSGSGLPNGDDDVGAEDIEPSAGGSGSSNILTLTDDSATVTGESTVAGVRYNVVSGSDGSLHASSSKYYGWIYPNVGIIALRGQMLSASLPGASGHIASSSVFSASGAGGVAGLAYVAATPTGGLGFAPNIATTDVSASNALKFAQSINMVTQAFRSEEDQTSKSYFCRAFANDFNYSNNPTFTSGSDAIIANTDMIGYPHTFITSIGLYQQGSSGPELVAVGKLSGPVQKNYGTEATIKVKLTY